MKRALAAAAICAALATPAAAADANVPWSQAERTLVVQLSVCATVFEALLLSCHEDGETKCLVYAAKMLDSTTGYAADLMIRHHTDPSDDPYVGYGVSEGRKIITSKNVDLMRGVMKRCEQLVRVD